MDYEVRKMRLEDYFDFLAPDDIRIKGHRIGIQDILYEFIHRARIPEEIVRCFPTLTLEQIYATILYYLHNKEQVDRYIADWLELGRKMRKDQASNPTPAILRLRQIKADRRAAERKDEYGTQ